jgi:P27 family predicted phage terminase small subunit
MLNALTKVRFLGVKRMGAPRAHLFELGLLSEIDAPLFAAYCASYSVWVRAEEWLARLGPQGLLTRTPNGHFVQSPLVSIAAKARRDMIRYAAELGMTPSSRSRIDTEVVSRAQHLDPAERYFD